MDVKEKLRGITIDLSNSESTRDTQIKEMKDFVKKNWIPSGKMKECPYCHRQIGENQISCPYCKRFLPTKYDKFFSIYNPPWFLPLAMSIAALILSIFAMLMK